MNKKKERKLDNPPIKDVVLAITFDSLFDENNTVNLYANEVQNKTGFNKVNTMGSFQVHIDAKTGMQEVKSIENAFLQSRDKKQSFSIELNKLWYSDKSKYKNFDNFYRKIDKIYSMLNVNKNFEVREIGLKYVNSFCLPLNLLDRHFEILPIFNNQSKDGNYYSLVKKYSNNINVVSSKFEKVGAYVSIYYTATLNADIKIDFIIDTYYKSLGEVKTFSEIYQKCSILREFKNEIFYGNIFHIDEIKEFHNASK